MTEYQKYRKYELKAGLFAGQALLAISLLWFKGGPMNAQGQTIPVPPPSYSPISTCDLLSGTIQFKYIETDGSERPACQGTLVTVDNLTPSNIVSTAAHCNQSFVRNLEANPNSKLIADIFGPKTDGTCTEGETERIEVTHVINNPEYTFDGGEHIAHDVGLTILDKSSTMKPALQAAGQTEALDAITIYGFTPGEGVLSRVRGKITYIREALGMHWYRTSPNPLIDHGASGSGVFNNNGEHIAVVSRDRENTDLTRDRNRTFLDTCIEYVRRILPDQKGRHTHIPDATGQCEIIYLQSSDEANNYQNYFPFIFDDYIPAENTKRP